MADRPCLCIYQLQDGKWVRRVTRCCPLHGYTGHWKVIK